MVTPGTVTLTGDSVEALGQEPKTQARIYDLKSDRFNIHVEGTGSLHVADDSAQGGDSGADAGEPPGDRGARQDLLAALLDFGPDARDARGRWSDSLPQGQGVTALEIDGVTGNTSATSPPSATFDSQIERGLRGGAALVVTAREKPPCCGFSRASPDHPKDR